MPGTTDIGVNLLHPQFADDLDAVIDRAAQAGVSRLMLTATDLDEAEALIAFCEEHQQDQRIRMWCTAGIHPHNAKGAAPGWQDALQTLGASEWVKAIGETGLDFFRSFSPHEQQKELFRGQLEVAAALAKPVFVHDRDSEGFVHSILEEYTHRLPGVVVHCFTGTERDLDNYLAAGHYVGITGWVCDQRRGESLRQLAPRIPLNKLLVETDAPFLRPHNAPKSKSRRNEPSLLPYVIAQLADLYQVEPSVIAQTTAQNAQRLFQLGD